MAPSSAPKEISEPFPISCVAGRYLLFDVDVVSHVRRNHNICGVLVGTIPNLSQQNVFLGIPLELMPEEARVLVEGGHAYVVDDVEIHRQGFQEMGREDRLKHLADMDRQGVEAANESLAAQERKKNAALKKKGLKTESTECQTTPSIANRTTTMKSTTTASRGAESTASDTTIHVQLPNSLDRSTLGFIMKGSGFSEQESQVDSSSIPSPSSELSISIASELGSSFIDLGSIMKGSSFIESSVKAKSQGIGQPINTAPALSSCASDLGSSFTDLGSIMKGSSFLEPIFVGMKVKQAKLEEVAPLLTKEEEAGSTGTNSGEAQSEAAMLKEFAAQAIEDSHESAPSIAEVKHEEAENQQMIESYNAEAAIFDSEPPTSVPLVKNTSSKSVFAQRQYITPTTSTPPLPTPLIEESRPLPVVPKSYPLFRFLHSRGYFFMPGLRFGCNYSVYPGDPLRYHSHFLATGLGWDEKFDLLDIVGGGRLGTGTKKAYMVGGESVEAAKDEGKENVRAFSIEWASM